MTVWSRYVQHDARRLLRRLRGRGWRWLVLMGAFGSVLTGLLWLALACTLSGCGNLGYYAQSLGGHLNLMNRARPVAEAQSDPAISAELRDRLVLSQRIRDYAVKELLLPDNASYRRYADLQRGAAVWNVVAAPELSLQLKTWCFPVMGCVGYRGYFDRAQADALAERLRAEGWEVSVYGVPAYSTLGWTNWLGGDPLLNTFIRWPEGELARIIFHELSHQVVYVNDDTTFNESFATAVERLGGERWLRTQADDNARREYAAYDARRRDFRALTLAHRERLARLYATSDDDVLKRRHKAEAMQRLRLDYESLKRERWGGFSGYDSWMTSANNAAFGVQAAYDDLVPQFERLFQSEGADFARFYAAVRKLAALPREERRRQLMALPNG